MCKSAHESGSGQQSQQQVRRRLPGGIGNLIGMLLSNAMGADPVFGGGASFRILRPEPTDPIEELFDQLIGVRIEHANVTKDVNEQPTVGLDATLLQAYQQARDEEDVLGQENAESRRGALRAMLHFAQYFAGIKKGLFPTIVNSAPDSLEAELAVVMQDAHANIRNLLEKIGQSYDQERESQAAQEQERQLLEEQEAREQIADREATELERQADQVRAAVASPARREDASAKALPDTREAKAEAYRG